MMTAESNFRFRCYRTPTLYTSLASLPQNAAVLSLWLVWPPLTASRCHCRRATRGLSAYERCYDALPAATTISRIRLAAAIDPDTMKLWSLPLVIKRDPMGIWARKMGVKPTGEVPTYANKAVDNSKV